MGKDCGSWVPQLHLDWQSPNLSSFSAPLDVGKQNGVSALMNSGIDNTMITRNETMPLQAHASSAHPHLQLAHSNELHGWFYCLPRFRQTFMPNAPNLGVVEPKILNGHVKGSSREEIGPSSESQKRFLVVDQTGDQTTFIYGSGLSSWHHSNLHEPSWNEPCFRRDVNDFNGLNFAAKVEEENQGTEMESEMHEDTEEINALLYSDSDGYSTDDDDEVTSTGHSPSTMTTHDDDQERLRGDAATEEIGSSVTKSKKRKLLEDCAYDDTASSLNLKKRQCENGDDMDAESRCSDEMGSLSGSKKMRKEKIRDILSILQTIIPGGKDKDPILLLDEAISCLKSLKLKARDLGLD